MSSAPQTQGSHAGSARAFIRSLNILLKFSRLYGLAHLRTNGQLQVAWDELQAALSGAGTAGFLLGVAAGKLLLDGQPLESGPAEQGFVQLLTTAGIGSVEFRQPPSHDDFSRLIAIFAKSGGKAALLSEQLKSAFGENSGGSIRINEIQYVAAEAGAVAAELATELTARTLEGEAGQLRPWLSSPQKLLQLIAAAEAKHDAGAKPGNGAAGPLEEQELSGLLRVLTQMGQQGATSSAEPTNLQQQVSQLSGGAQHALQEALARMAASGKAQEADPKVLMKVAEHLSIRFALERFERGEVRVNAIRELLERKSREMEALRKVLGAYEDKMQQAGMVVESHADILDRQFWAAVPDAGKRAVLLSPNAWCIPPRNLRAYVEELLAKGDRETAGVILKNYASCLTVPDRQALRKTAVGLSELAALYAQVGGDLLESSIRRVGEQLNCETDADLQILLSATLVHLGQEAINKQNYPGIQQALERADKLEEHYPSLGRNVKQRITVENRLHKFIEEALLAPRLPLPLIELLRRSPIPAADHLVTEYNKCSRRDRMERLVELGKLLGTIAHDHLAHVLRLGPPGEAVAVLGLLSRLNVEAVQQVIPTRVGQWSLFHQNGAVQQIAGSAAPERGLLLLGVLDALDARVVPQALDEIGMSGERTATSKLISLAEGQLPEGNSSYIQLKAVEALTRLREPFSESSLWHLLEARRWWHWKYPRELRLAVAQALLKINPEAYGYLAPVREFSAAELGLAPLDPDPKAAWSRQRRYQRVTLAESIGAVLKTKGGNCSLAVKTMSLGGGAGTKVSGVVPGNEATIDLRFGLRRLHPQVLVRDIGSRQVAFEIVNFDLEERSRLRNFLTTHLPTLSQPGPRI